MFFGKWDRNIRILIKFHILWFYSQHPSIFWLSYSTSIYMPELIDSVIRINETFYPKKFLAECKYEIKNKMENLINYDLDASSSDSESYKSDSESRNESDNDESYD